MYLIQKLKMEFFNHFLLIHIQLLYFYPQIQARYNHWQQCFNDMKILIVLLNNLDNHILIMYNQLENMVMLSINIFNK